MVKVKDLGEQVECPICGTQTKPDATECPECGEILEDVLVIEEQGGGRASRMLFRIGLIVFLIGFFLLIYSPLHDGLGRHGVPTFIGGYEAYNIFGPLNWQLVWIGTWVLIPGIIIVAISLVVAIFGRRAKVETVSEKTGETEEEPVTEPEA